jgi:hypothetical protein
LDFEILELGLISGKSTQRSSNRENMGEPIAGLESLDTQYPRASSELLQRLDALILETTGKAKARENFLEPNHL